MPQRNIDRVEAHTDEPINEMIRMRTDANIAFYAEHPELIPARLRQLDREWDVERALETGSASLSLIGLVLGVFRSRRWLLLPLTVQSFFLQHALQGWCPPLPLFRRLGVRTMREILRERERLEELAQGEKSPGHKPTKKTGKPAEALAAR